MLSSIENANCFAGRDASLNSKAPDHCCPGTTSYSQNKHFYEAKKKNIYTSYSASSQEENVQKQRNKAYAPRAQNLVDIRNYLENLSYLLEQDEISHHYGKKIDLSKVMKLSDEVQSPPKRRRRRRRITSKVEIKNQNDEDEEKEDNEKDDEDKVELVVVQPISFMVKIQELISVDSEEIEVTLC